MKIEIFFVNITQDKYNYQTQDWKSTKSQESRLLQALCLVQKSSLNLNKSCIYFKKNLPNTYVATNG